MAVPRFLQIHTLTHYTAALLNRDDLGFAKRLPFGGSMRARVSSQCLKRHWRTHDGEFSLGELDAPQTFRSRHTFELKVAGHPSLARHDAAHVHFVVCALMDEVLGQGRARVRRPESSALRTPNLTVLGGPEVEYLARLAGDVLAEAGLGSEVRATGGPIAPISTEKRQALEAVLSVHMSREFRANLRGIRLGAGLDAALFGRMVTSDVLARVDSAIHVAHAFTVHTEASEPDYFSAVDELLASAGPAAGGASGHNNTMELGSGLFYGYVVVDVAQLVCNLEGCPREGWVTADRVLAAGVVERLAGLVATVSPGAKRGSTAPYAAAHCVLVESGNQQPRSLANAFLSPVRERPDLVANAYASLGEHVAELDGMYGAPAARALAAIGPHGLVAAPAGIAQPVNLGELRRWMASQVLA